MFANSRSVTSSQNAAHPRLAEIVERHLHNPYRRVPSAMGRAAFARIASRLAQNDGRIVLDAGCGTGLSAFALARRHPGEFVVGVDKSAARLAVGGRVDRGPGDDIVPPNAALLRCDLVDFWQLAAAAGVRCSTQYLLYPNPWPKPEHVMRRWHAHPVLPSLLALGGTIELRTNWRIYADEFEQALALAGRRPRTEQLVRDEPLTPFEHKYLASGHALWICRA